MNKSLTLLFVFLTARLLTSCSRNESVEELAIVRTEKISIYEGVKEGDELKNVKPVDSLTIAEELQMKWRWEIKHFDRFDNMVLCETYYLKEGVEEIIETWTKYYINPKIHKVGKVVHQRQDGKVDSTVFVYDYTGWLASMIYYREGVEYQRSYSELNEKRELIGEKVYMKNILTSEKKLIRESFPLSQTKKVITHELEYSPRSHEEYWVEFLNKYNEVDSCNSTIIDSGMVTFRCWSFIERDEERNGLITRIGSVGIEFNGGNKNIESILQTPSYDDQGRLIKLTESEKYYTDNDPGSIDPPPALYTLGYVYDNSGRLIKILINDLELNRTFIVIREIKEVK